MLKYIVLNSAIHLYNEILQKTPDTLSERKRLEFFFAAAAVVGFLVHLLAIVGSKAGLIINDFLAKQNIISSITTPFTIILIYEVILLVISTSRPLINSLLTQFEVISLIFIRDIFKLFSEIPNADNGNYQGIITELVLTLVISFTLFMGVLLMNWFLKKDRQLCEMDSAWIQKIKKLLTSILLVVLAILFLSYILQFSTGGFIRYVAEGFPLTNFFIGVFTMMIIADVLQFIMTFFDKQTYLQLFRVAAYLISTILIRAALTVPHPQDVILVLISLVVAIGVTMLSLDWEKFRLHKK